MLPPKKDEDLLIGGSPYTFDYMAKLSNEDPERFEEIRQELLEKEFKRLEDHNPERAMDARRAQFALDGELRKLKNPQMRAALVYRKMIEKLKDLQDVMTEAKEGTKLSTDSVVDLKAIQTDNIPKTKPIGNKTINVDFVQRKRRDEKRPDNPTKQE